SRGNLEPWDIALSFVAAEGLLQVRQPTLHLFVPPHSSRRMEHVHVGDLGKWCRHPLKREARFKQPEIDHLSVVGDDARAMARKLAHGFEQRAFGGKIREKELTRPESARLKPSAADKKRICARASCKPRRLEVEKQHLTVGAAQQLEARPGRKTIRNR